MPWPKNGLFKITPRGIKVYLRRNTWFNHICAFHPELSNWLHDILLAIEQPEAIYDYKGTCFSFSERRGKFIMLVYRIVGRAGRIKTAYAVLNPYVEVQGLNKVWPR